MIEDWHPAVIVGNPANLGRPRFRNALYQVVPATSWKENDDFRAFTKNAALYPVIKQREGGFERDSVILIDQIMTLDLNYLLATGKPKPGSKKNTRISTMGQLNQQEAKVILGLVTDYFRAQKIGHLSEN